MLNAKKQFKKNSLKNYSTYISVAAVMKMMIEKLPILSFSYRISKDRLMYQLMTSRLYSMQLSKKYQRPTQNLFEHLR